MTLHARTRRLRDRLPTARTRAVLSLGIVLGLASVNTLAYWTDTGTMTTGTIQSGTLDLQLSGNLAGQGGTWTNSGLAMTGMVPGESVAANVTVQRAAGSIGFTWTAAATSTGGLASSLRWDVYAGTANAVVTTNGIRTQSCGGTALATGVTLSATSTPVVTPARTLNGGTMSEALCVRAALPSTAGAAAMGTSATASFVFDATQIS